MKVLMFGWEFPPFNTGGIGIACHGLAKSMTKQNMNITFVMPKAPPEASSDMVNLVVADRIKLTPSAYDQISKELNIKQVDSLIIPYMNSADYFEAHKRVTQSLSKLNKHDIEYQNKGSDFNIDNQYGPDLFAEVWRFSNKAALVALKENFDIIHAHDWQTFQAGIIAKQVSGKPLVVHIHNTSFDRSGGNPSQEEYEIERNGFHSADKVIAISHYVKKTLLAHYGVPEEKIEVVHNGIDVDGYAYLPVKKNINEKMILYAGRVTLQKGPDYFIQAAHKILQHRKDVKFVLAGGGDMLNRCINMAAELGISKNFIFTGRFNKEEGRQIMSMADVFVMPSVSEPFGLVPLESMLQKTPTIISKQSGVSEVLQNTLKVDFWDINQLASKMLAAIDYPVLHEQLTEYGEGEAKSMTWDPAATKCKSIFSQLIEQNTMQPNPAAMSAILQHL